MTIDRSKLLRRSFVAVWIVVCFIVVVFTYQSQKPLPAGISYSGREHPVTDVEFLSDLTYVDATGARVVEQTIFDEIFEMISGARRFILLDMFLYNPFQGPVPETTRALSGEMTAALTAQKRRFPEIEIVLITDPINTVYGGMASPQFEALEAAGVRVVTTNLQVLRDSNPIYSTFWRLLIRPFGNGAGGELPNPFGAGRVSARSYLDLLNFKANHRKTILADDGDGLVGLVTSANPHDGSSAHGNLAIRFDRSGQIAQLVFPKLSDAILKVNSLHGGFRQLNLSFQVLQQVVPSARLLIQAIERLDSPDIFGVQVDHVLIGLDGSLRVGELLLIERAQLVVDSLLLL